MSLLHLFGMAAAIVAVGGALGGLWSGSVPTPWFAAAVGLNAITFGVNYHFHQAVGGRP